MLRPGLYETIEEALDHLYREKVELEDVIARLEKFAITSRVSAVPVFPSAARGHRSRKSMGAQERQRQQDSMKG
jgi:hypothetical protein